jgi:hypothetical protein
MIDPTKGLVEMLKNSSLARVPVSDSTQKMLDAINERNMAFDVPQLFVDFPKVDPVRIPTQKERNAYQSAGVLVRRFAETVAQWRAQVPADSQPAVIAILQTGVQVSVSLLAEESFHGIRIEGTIDGTPCVVLTHQASVQLLCFAAKVEKEEFRRKIGFVIDGQESQA